MSDDERAHIDPQGNLHVPARVIPPPASMSDAARAFLASPQSMTGARSYPTPGDDAGWQEHVDEQNGWMNDLAERTLAVLPVEVETTAIAGVPVHVAIPKGVTEADRAYAHIAVHGGAMVYGEGTFAKSTAAAAAVQTQCPAYGVDFRNPPRHPYPAALDDCVAVYRALLETHAPGTIVISGGSGGGNLAAACVLKARDDGLPLPAALALSTPEVDLTESGDSFVTNRDVDIVLCGPLPETVALYAAGEDLTHPYLSPLFGDFEQGFPPTIILTGTRDVFLSNSVRMHRALLRAGVEAELHVWEGVPHGLIGGPTPEESERSAQTGTFLRRQLGLA